MQCNLIEYLQIYSCFIKRKYLEEIFNYLTIQATLYEQRLRTFALFILRRLLGSRFSFSRNLIGYHLFQKFLSF